MAITITIAAIAIPMLARVLDAARIARAAADISTLQSEITMYGAPTGDLPDTLADIGRGNFLDPWGNPYQYLNIAGGGPGVLGAVRKDRFLIPLNSDYDLYSMGKDGQSVPPLTANVSRDDIVRANDGAYIGLASQY